MNAIQEDLQALELLLQDLRLRRETEEKIAAQRKRIEDFKESCKHKNLPKEPVKDEHLSRQMEQEQKRLDSKNNIWVVFYFLICVALCVIGCLTSSTPVIWKCILLAVVSWFAGCFGPIGWVVGVGLSVWFGWSIWTGMSLIWKIVMIALCVGNLVITCIVQIVDKPVKEMTAKIQAQKEAEEREFQAALRNHKTEVKAAAEGNLARSKATLDAMGQTLENLKKTRDQASKSIADNPVLDKADKEEAVVEYVLAQLQRKRAASLTEALRMYDGEKEKERQQQKRIADMKLRYEMEKIERDRKAWADLEESNRQFAMEMDRKQELKRQTEELERIRKALEE